jgi:hypothetical protein
MQWRQWFCSQQINTIPHSLVLSLNKNYISQAITLAISILLLLFLNKNLKDFLPVICLNCRWKLNNWMTYGLQQLSL